jgi:hypothetical protein
VNESKRVESADGGKRYFRSKVDPIFWILSIAACAFGPVAAVVFAATGIAEPGKRHFILVAGLPLLATALVLWVLLATGYTITGDALVARSGPIRRRVELRKIESIAPSRRWNHGLGLSVQMLNIQYEGSSWGLDVSPADREGFYQALCDAMPSLQRTGDRVLRT